MLLLSCIAILETTTSLYTRKHPVLFYSYFISLFFFVPTFAHQHTYSTRLTLLVSSSPLHHLLLRLLEQQLQTQRRTYDSEVESLRGELQNVKEENNRQQQLLAQNLQLPPEARIEASLQHEITRLTNENLVRCTAHTNRLEAAPSASLCLRCTIT